MKQINLPLSSGSERHAAFRAAPGPEPDLEKSAPNHCLQETSELQSIFVSLVYQYFPSRIDVLDYKLSWSSRRQKRTLATCNLRKRKITVAQELRHQDYQCFLSPLIYHELCHAILGYSVRSAKGKNRWHGREFRNIESLHPQIAELNLWIKTGGWQKAVRRHRARQSFVRKSACKAGRKSSFLSRILNSLISE